jgi:magnesium transporter
VVEVTTTGSGVIPTPEGVTRPLSCVDRIAKMLRFHASGRPEIKVSPDAKAMPAEVNWIDVLKPDSQEIAFLERTPGIELPTLEELSQIERSSRLRSERDWLRLSLPVIYQIDGFLPALTPLGIALSKDRLLTIRFRRIKALDNVFDDIARFPIQTGGIGALIAVVEAIIDHTADLLERVRNDLDRLSEEILGINSVDSTRQKPHEHTGRLRFFLREIGRKGDLTSKIDDVLLCMARMLPYVTVHATPQLESGNRAKFKNLERDVKSLNDYETHLAEKIQLLLDAIVGLTNIEQNNIFRILTVVSVVGIPPTFFASMWGMNFKHMAELDWSYGYEFGLSVIALSAIIPFVWFKWRGWC